MIGARTDAFSTLSTRALSSTLGFLFEISLVFVFEYNLLFISVVTRDSLDLSVGWHLEFVSGITVEEFSLLNQHLLDSLANILVKFLHKAMLLPVLIHLLLNESKSSIDNLLVEFQFGLFLIEIFLSSLYFDRVEV